MYYFKTTCIFFVIAIFSSCDLILNRNGAGDILDRAEALIEQCPDSALTLLSTDIQEKNMGRDDYYRYVLLNTWIRSKNGLDIKGDSLVFQARDYFLEKGDIQKIAQAYYFCGLVSESQKNNEEALSMYLEAEAYAKRTNDDRLKGSIYYSIGFMNSKKFLNDEAISNFKTSTNYFSKSGNYKNEIQAYNLIGTSFFLKKEQDSSFYYLDKSLLLAKSRQDSVGQGVALQNIGLTYSMMKDNLKARETFRHAFPFFKKEEDKARVYLNIAYSFYGENNRDSTEYYINRSLALIADDKTSVLRSIIIRLQARMEENDKNYEKALSYQKEYANYLQTTFEETNNQAILDMQKKYDFEVIQNENNRLVIERQSLGFIAFVLIALFIVAIILLFRKYKRNKRALADGELQISELKELVDSLDEKEDSFRKLLLERFDIYKKLAMFENYERDKQGQKVMKKMNEIFYNKESLDQNIVYEMVEQIYAGFPEALKKKYPHLEEPEVRICCFVLGRLTNAEISFFMGLASNTVQVKKTIIRKKIGIEGYGNMTDFLQKIWEESKKSNRRR